MTGLLLLAGLTGWVTWRLRRIHADRRAAALAWTGVAVFAVATVGPLGAWLSGGGFALHTLQHLLLLSVAAALLLAGTRRAPSTPMPPRAATLWLIAGVGTFWLTLLSPAVLAAAQTPALDALQHALLLGAGAAIAVPLAGSRALRGFAAGAYLVVCELTIGAAGIALAWAPELFYAAAVFEPNALGLSPETDQALAGAFILVLEEPLLAIEFAVVFIAGLAESERQSAAEDAAELQQQIAAR